MTPSAKNRKGKKTRREVADSDEDEHPASDEHESVGELAKVSCFNFQSRANKLIISPMTTPVRIRDVISYR